MFYLLNIYIQWRKSVPRNGKVQVPLYKELRPKTMRCPKTERSKKWHDEFCGGKADHDKISSVLICDSRVT